jgi:hypothetical protein
MSLCPEADTRARMSDEEFWDHVFNLPLPEGWDTTPSAIDIEDMEAMSHLANPCPECGQWGACAYDTEGRAMVHVTEVSNG